MCQVLGVSVTGASHVRIGAPNQDAIRSRPDTGMGMPLSLAVADGHGSATSFRSSVGSQFAVETASDAVYQFLENHRDSPAPLIKRMAEERLPREIHLLWTERVRVCIHDQPFSDEELQTVEKRGGSRALQKLNDNPLLAYGSTLLVVGIMESLIVYLQLGDGDILTVDSHGQVSRPLPVDELLFADETTSLCLPEAWNEFRFGYQAIVEHRPALLMLSTDGYANCFASEADFLRAGKDMAPLVQTVQTRGSDQLKAELIKHLEDATQQYSGDDITVGLVWFPASSEERLGSVGANSL